MIHQDYNKLKRKQKRFLKKRNKIDLTYNNGIYNRYKNPVVTRNHVPLDWRYDLSLKTNPFFMERLMVNATFNSGAIYFNGYFYLMIRLEGADRKSIFALAKSKSGIDRFEFERIINFPNADQAETNRYDMRLVHHEDGFIYGIFCAEKQDSTAADTHTAIAETGFVRTKDLINWERLPNLKSKFSHQRNIVLHPEFVNNKYVLYTRPQDDFIEAGTKAGIYLGELKDMKNPNLPEEHLIHEKRYHTVYELKSGQGPQPIKTKLGFIHLAHGVRITAAGLSYVLYVFATDLNDLTKVIARPSGYFLAPLGKERVGDVSNVVFSNGWIVKDEKVYIYYASSDTRVHVTTTTLEKLIDYTFYTPEEVFISLESAEQRIELINKNKNL